MQTIKQSAEKLLTTLNKTESEISALREGLSAQLDALRRRRTGALHTSTEKVNSVNESLRSLLEAKNQQSEILSAALELEDNRTDLQSLIENLSHVELGSELEGVRTRIQEQVATTNRLYEDLAFALHFSATLDEEMLISVVEHAGGKNASAYSASGETKGPSGGGRLLNKIA